MATPQDIADEIVEQALDPVSSTSDGQTATGRGTADQVLAAKQAAASRGQRRRLRGVAITQLITPGALDDCGRTPSFDQPGGYY